MRLNELNRNIPEPPGFDNFERSYSSAVYWARGITGCTRKSLSFKQFYTKNLDRTVKNSLS